MGCDIHVWIEKKQADGTWEVIDSPSDTAMYTDEDKWDREDYERRRAKFPLVRDRNYERFAKLAGVRRNDTDDDCPEPNGWPSDICESMRQFHGDGDLHSHCHYRIPDAAKIFSETEYRGHGTSPLIPFANAAPELIYFAVDPTQENVDDYRLLIAFDN